jgi:hypothetical protein
MGAYSSWAMLALTHHFIVQLAARRVGFVGWFPYYAVLGDDVVIADEAVANVYLRIMRDLGVGINMSKSLVSPMGIFEFAKRLVSWREEYTPIGPANLLLALRNWQSIPSLFIDLAGKGLLYNPVTILKMMDSLASFGPLGLSKKTIRLLKLVMVMPGGYLHSYSTTTGLINFDLDIVKE